MNSSSFRINPALDPEELSRAFAMRRRLHIPSFLEPECAGNLLEYLKGDPGWKLVVNSEDKLFELDRPTQASLTAEQQQLSMMAGSVSHSPVLSGNRVALSGDSADNIASCV